MSESLHRRAREIRARLAVRAWEFRQRHHAKGVWFRLRRVLADTEFAFAIDDADADALAREGGAELQVGRELAPAKRLYLVDRERAERLSSRVPLVVRIGMDLLAARNVALVPFEGVAKRHVPGAPPSAGPPRSGAPSE
jgi:hypothetical protein